MDPRDKICGILGLVSMLLPKVQLQTIQVNYHLSTLQLFTQVASALIDHTSHLILFSRPKPTLATRENPSCVPDFVDDKRWVQGDMLGQFIAGITPGQRALRALEGNKLLVCRHLLNTLTMVCSDPACFPKIAFISNVRTNTLLQPNVVASYYRISAWNYRKGHAKWSDSEKILFQSALLCSLQKLSSYSEPSCLQDGERKFEALRQICSKDTLPPQQEIHTWSTPDLFE